MPDTWSCLFCDTKKMALYRYFKTVDVLPAPSGSLSASVSPATIKDANYGQSKSIDPVTNFPQIFGSSKVHWFKISQFLFSRNQPGYEKRENFHRAKISRCTVYGVLLYSIMYT